MSHVSALTVLSRGSQQAFHIDNTRVRTTDTPTTGKTDMTTVKLVTVQ